MEKFYEHLDKANDHAKNVLIHCDNVVKIWNDEQKK